MNKRGISAVVATILIILLAVIAVVTIWAVLKPFLERTGEKIEEKEGCLYLNLEIESISYDSVDDELTVKVFRDAGKASLKKLIILADGVTAAEITDIADLPDELETETYIVTDMTSKPGKVEVGGFLEGDVSCGIVDSASV